MTIPLDEIAIIVGRQLGVRQVHGGDHLVHDLAAESMDIVNIVAIMEEKYGVTIDESALATIGTVAELHELVQRRAAGNDHGP